MTLKEQIQAEIDKETAGIQNVSKFLNGNVAQAQVAAKEIYGRKGMIKAYRKVRTMIDAHEASETNTHIERLHEKFTK